MDKDTLMTLHLKKDAKKRRQAGDFDTWGDKLIVLAVVALPAWIIIRALIG